MDWFSLLILIIKFVVSRLPDMISEYKRSLADTRYKTEADRIDAVIKRLNSTQGRGKLDVLRELEK